MQKITLLLLFISLSVSGKKQASSELDLLQERAVSQSVTQQSVDYTEEDRAIFERYREQLPNSQKLPLNELIIKTARFFLDRPYVAHTLEKSSERLVVNLREFDCMTFVESVLALSRTMKEQAPTFERFCHHLQQARYRTEEITDYTDRLHYTSDWIYENQQRGVIEDITQRIGGVPHSFSLDFMSTHPDSYQQLKSHPERIRKIHQIEQTISARKGYYYLLPEQQITQRTKELAGGEMVCFVTKIKGLDIAHVGFLYREKEQLTFIHASSTAKKIIINPEPLQTYVEKGKTRIGVIIIQPLAMTE